VDLVAEAVRRQQDGVMFATVIYARQLDISIGRCITDLEALSKAAVAEDAQGQVIFL